MILSLIGMSGSGKTYWAKKLEATGFKRYSCDDMIEQKLASELHKLGYQGINDVAKWLGQPFESHYQHTSKKYLELELECMEETFSQVLAHPNQDTIIDTTGSFIYMPEQTIQDLQKLSKVVFLSTPQVVKDAMLNQYFADPKPVIWGSRFQKRADESSLQAVKRCYPELLNHRIEQYKQIAHTTMSYFLLRQHDFTQQDFLERIQPIYDQL